MGERSKAKRGGRKVSARVAKTAIRDRELEGALASLRRTGFLSEPRVADLLAAHIGKPLPAWLNRYLVRLLRGEIKRPRGRPRHVAAAMDFLLGDVVDLYESKRKEYAGLPKSQRPEPKSKSNTGADPNLLALEHVMENVPEIRKLGISELRLRNLLSKYGWLQRRPHRARIQKR